MLMPEAHARISGSTLPRPSRLQGFRTREPQPLTLTLRKRQGRPDARLRRSCGALEQSCPQDTLPQGSEAKGQLGRLKGLVLRRDPS